MSRKKQRRDFAANLRDKAVGLRMLPLPALVAKWQTRTLEVRVEKSMGVRVSPSALSYRTLFDFLDDAFGKASQLFQY